jgi:hypothetical protein
MARKGDAAPSRLLAAAPSVAVPRPAPLATAAKGRRRITLRLDADRHLRLKLAAAHRGLSLQDIVIAALDVHLTREAPCPCIAADPE